MGWAQPSRPGLKGPPPAIGKLYGKVLDGADKSGLEYSTLSLFKLNQDSIITGTLVKNNGDFLLEKIPLGSYRLRISYLGYQTQELQVVVSFKTPEIDLGNIILQPDNRVLEEISIEARKNTIQMNIDRRVYEVGKDLSAIGGTGIDVMRNIPGITVDTDGNINLRNQSPTVFVDGRPSALTLEQIPAEQIDRIEIITNPSVKFDAGTTGGIVNVVLKKNTLPGYNGTLSAGAGLPERYSINSNLNLKEGPWSATLGYSLNQSSGQTLAYTDRVGLNENQSIGAYRQDSRMFNRRRFNVGRISLEYQLSNRSTLSLNANAHLGDFLTVEKQSFSLNQINGNPVLYGDRKNDQNRDFKNGGSSIAHKYIGAKKEWSTDLTYNVTDSKNNDQFFTWNYTAMGITIPPYPEQQKNTGAGFTQNITWQTDYVRKLSDSTRIEAGLRAFARNTNSDLLVNKFMVASNSFEIDTSLTNEYLINDQVYAAYINYSGKILKWGYSGGIRYEQTRFKGTVPNKNQTFSYYYPDGTQNLEKAFFPSLYLSRKLGDKQEIQINFSRKINRPNQRQIMPFVQFADRQNLQIGNPKLAPEFINLGEINQTLRYAKGNWFSSIYGRYTEDIITNYFYPLPANPSIWVGTFINGKNSFSAGWENAWKHTLFPFLDLTISANVYHVSIKVEDGINNYANKGFSGDGKILLQFRPRKDFAFQINGNYQAPEIVVQGKTREIYSMDLSINKDFFKKFSCSFQVNDVFNSRKGGGYIETADYRQAVMRRRDPRSIRLTLTWRFGETDVSIFRKKPTKSSRDSGMDMDF